MSDNDPSDLRDEEPTKPTRSLPSYREPTPETHRKFSRETEAELALKNTSFVPGTAPLLVLFFLITIAAVPLIQFAVEYRNVRSVRALPTFAAFGSLVPHHPIHSIVDLKRVLPKPDEIKSVQKTLETESVVAQWLLPRVDSVLTGKLRAGNEQVYLGRDDWLFYRADVDYVIGPPFLDPFWIKRRTLSAGVQPDAVRAIVDFRDQLARRGIDLIVVPVPVKPTIEANMLSSVSPRAQIVENESSGEFKTKLQNAGVRLFDIEPFLGQNENAYLRTDTHWRPETMERVANELAKNIRSAETATNSRFQIVDQKVNALGDLGRLLKLPSSQLSRYNEETMIHRVTVNGAIWRADPKSDLLLLGDSFSNIFSLGALGWGDSAGLAEHLSYALGGKPIDCILRNSDGAFATREILHRELARGRDRLAGKKIVIWEFVTRELAFGDWKFLDMSLRPAPPSHFYVPQTGQKVSVTGTVESISTVPTPGSAPYADHIMSVHLVDVNGTPNREPVECLVYLWSMRDNVWTKAARLRPGDEISVRLQPWSDVSAQLDKINRSEIEDASQLEEPCWGELTN
jgi:hypothetical protein